MRDEGINLAALNVVAFENLFAEQRHLPHRELEDRSSILVNEMHLLVDGIVTGWIQASAAWHVQRLATRSVDFVQKVDETDGVVFGGLEQDRACSIAKDDAGGAVGVVDDRRHYVCSDDEHFLVGSGRNELRSRLQGINKRRTSAGEIESPDVLRAEFVLDKTRGRGKKHIGRNRPDDDRVEVGGRDAALVERFLGCFNRKIAGRNAFVDQMAFADAYALHDPLVVCVDKFFQIGVGEKTRRNVGAESADLNALKLSQ